MILLLTRQSYLSQKEILEWDGNLEKMGNVHTTNVINHTGRGLNFVKVGLGGTYHVAQDAGTAYVVDGIRHEQTITKTYRFMMEHDSITTSKIFLLLVKEAERNAPFVEVPYEEFVASNPGMDLPGMDVLVKYAENYWFIKMNFKMQLTPPVAA